MHVYISCDTMRAVSFWLVLVSGMKMEGWSLARELYFWVRNKGKRSAYYKIYWGWPKRGGVETPIVTMAFNDGICFVQKWTSFSLFFFLFPVELFNDNEY